MNPYAYVAQNPETNTDPSGQMVGCPGCGDNGDGGSGNNNGNNNGNPTPPPDHGPTCGPDPSSCDGGNQPTPKPTPHAKQVSLTRCDVECQSEKNAQQLARDAANRFAAIANIINQILNWFSNVGVALVLSALGVYDFFQNKVYAGVMITLASLASIAQDFANGFAAEANHSLGWFTQEYVQDAGLNIIDAAEAEGYKDMMEAAGAVVAGIVISLVSDGLLAEFGATLAAEGTAAEFVIGGGLNIMEDYASGVMFVQQENLYMASITI